MLLVWKRRNCCWWFSNPANQLGCKQPVNDGINYQPQLVSERRISEPSTVGKEIFPQQPRSLPCHKMFTRSSTPKARQRVEKSDILKGMWENLAMFCVYYIYICKYLHTSPNFSLNKKSERNSRKAKMNIIFTNFSGWNVVLIQSCFGSSFTRPPSPSVS